VVVETIVACAVVPTNKIADRTAIPVLIFSIRFYQVVLVRVLEGFNDGVVVIDCFGMTNDGAATG
jgi:hypothetical protein